MAFVWALEKEFDIEVPDEKAFELATVEQAVNYISQKITSIK